MEWAVEAGGVEGGIRGADCGVGEGVEGADEGWEGWEAHMRWFICCSYEG